MEKARNILKKREFEQTRKELFGAQQKRTFIFLPIEEV